MNRRTILLGASGLGILAGTAFLARLSHGFVYGEDHAGRPLGLLVVVLLLLSGIHAVAVWTAAGLRGPLSRIAVAGLWVVALGARLSFLGSNPIQEDDFYRYLWDGRVLLSGADPYRHAPVEVLASGEAAGPSLGRLAALAHESPQALEALERVNHPDLTTIYPPLSTGVFAISQALFPWSLDGLRLVLLGFDLGVMLLLWKLLARLGRPQGLWIVYAWCPLLIKEFANSAHADAIPVFFVTACFLAMTAGRPLLASSSLAAGILAKLYPLVLVPLLLAWLWRQGRRTFLTALAILASASLVSFGTLLAHAPAASGLHAYATGWRANSSLYRLLEWASAQGGLPTLSPRILTGILLLGWGLWQTIRIGRAGRPAELLHPCFSTLAACFCLSPTQDPWYIAWVLPSICLFPSAAWLTLPGLLGLYYLQFWMEYHLEGTALAGLQGALSQRLLWWEFAPFYGLMLWQGWRAWRTRLSRSFPLRPRLEAAEVSA